MSSPNLSLKISAPTSIRLRDIALIVGSACVGASAGVLIYRYLIEKRRQQHLSTPTNDLEEIKTSVFGLRDRLAAIEDALRTATIGSNKRARKPKQPLTRTRSYVADSDDSSLIYYSAAESESELDDFYDVLPPGSGDTSLHNAGGDASRPLLNGTSTTADLESVLARFDEMIASTDTEQITDAFNYLVQQAEIRSSTRSHPDLLWRLAQAHLRYAMDVLGKQSEHRVEHFFQAKTYALEAREIAPQHVEVLKWSAITIGTVAKHGSVPLRQKIEDGLLVRQTLEEALELDPNDDTLHHLHGRWLYEVANLTWVERKFVQTWFGGEMNASIEEARAAFERVEASSPRRLKSNLLYLAKCALASDPYDPDGEARRLLETARDLERLPNDVDCEEEIRKQMLRLPELSDDQVDAVAS